MIAILLMGIIITAPVGAWLGGGKGEEEEGAPAEGAPAAAAPAE